MGKQLFVVLCTYVLMWRCGPLGGSGDGGIFNFKRCARKRRLSLITFLHHLVTFYNCELLFRRSFTQPRVWEYLCGFSRWLSISVFSSFWVGVCYTAYNNWLIRDTPTVMVAIHHEWPVWDFRGCYWGCYWRSLFSDTLTSYWWRISDAEQS